MNATQRARFADQATRLNREINAINTPANPLHEASAAMLSELQKAHALIILMLNELTPAAKHRFIVKAERADLVGEGVTRFHERAAVIARAMGVAA